ncbi:LysR family transcriptional regulator [Pseudoalteromonas xiamenensis]|uniref:LysR family transcriptional regulator n=1 Tax=Pseudoalteromonas xiamenensis TaxID=882626 RepID=UPI0027E4AC54|nr:LysR family transcriptional regulator [Pseudoalteromonas xiamenensis]WMN60711.1 LysR family transcriptional regulator [Pseudoalteromonas xiamenensis]WMN60817.1 LysR family transcriptional regulator [Pseudoalteromonas xiamenensis]
MDINKLDLKKLKYLVTVAQELSFSRAAERLNIAQPPLSQQIKKIEESFNIKLFERSTRQVKLTAQGERIVQQAGRVLEAHSELMQYIRSQSDVDNAPLRLGAIGLAIDVLIAPRMMAFRQRRPNDVIQLEEGTTQQLLTQCHNKLIDAAVIRLHEMNLPEEHLYLLKREAYVLAVPKSWSEFGEHVCLSQLKGKPYIGYPRELHPELYDEIYAVLDSVGVMPKLVQKVRTKSATLALVANQIGCAIVPKSLSTKYQQDIHFAYIEQALPTVDYYFYCQDKRLHPGMADLIKVLKT